MGGSTMTGAAIALAEALALPLQFGGGFLELAILFFVLAIIAGIAGASGVAGLSMQVAKILVFVFLVLAIVSLVL